MLLILRREGTTLETVSPGPDWRLPEDTVWIDLVEPVRQEELAIEGALDLELPTREEMAEIEVSSRLYQDHDATFMIASLLCGGEGADPILGPVTFVLAGERLITIRYVQPRVFAASPRRPCASRT
jgi:magnesium transporter